MYSLHTPTITADHEIDPRPTYRCSASGAADLLALGDLGPCSADEPLPVHRPTHFPFWSGETLCRQHLAMVNDVLHNRCRMCDMADRVSGNYCEPCRIEVTEWNREQTRADLLADLEHDRRHEVTEAELDRGSVNVAAALVAFALSAIVLVSGLLSLATAVDGLAQCEWEDSTDCYWDAETMGNGLGRSFFDMGGVVTYVD